MSIKYSMESLMGRTFGSWTVVAFDSEGSSRRKKWIVLCQCGTRSSLSGTQLQSGRSRYCRACFGQTDIRGKVFGQRTVIEKSRHPTFRGIRWLCRCACGREDIIRRESLEKGLADRCHRCALLARPPLNKTHGELHNCLNDKAVASKYHRKRKYGLTQDDYETMLIKQGGVCAICCQPEIKKCLYVDHCHNSLVVRGLLCSRCNLGIGMFQDSPDLMRLAASYLENKDNH